MMWYETILSKNNSDYNIEGKSVLHSFSFHNNNMKCVSEIAPRARKIGDDNIRN